MKRLLSIVLALVLLLSGCDLPSMDAELSAEGLEVHYIDVGQADSIFINCEGETMLIDGGNVADSQLVVSYLKSQGVETLQYVVNTHAHEDHVGGLAGVLAALQAERVWCPVTTY